MSEARQRRRRPSLLLMLLCLGLGYGVYVQLGADNAGQTFVAQAPVPREAPEAAPAPRAFTMAPLDAFSETLERPLFLPSRRPLVTDEAPQQGGSPLQRNLFSLMGVIISSDERMAIVERRATGEVLRLVEGQHVDGWLVDEILPDRLRLSSGEATEEVALEDRPPAARKKDERRPRPSRETVPGANKGR